MYGFSTQQKSFFIVSIQTKYFHENTLFNDSVTLWRCFLKNSSTDKIQTESTHQHLKFAKSASCRLKYKTKSDFRHSRSRKSTSNVSNSQQYFSTVEIHNKWIFFICVNLSKVLYDHQNTQFGFFFLNISNHPKSTFEQFWCTKKFLWLV